MKFLLHLLLPAVLLFACNKSSVETQVLIVADHKVDCTGVGPQRCFLVKQTETGSWQYLYSGIEGFDYQEGFTYRIEVEIRKVANPPADGSSKRYILKRVISKQ